MRTKKYVSHANKDLQTIMENFRRFVDEPAEVIYNRDSQLLLFEGKKVVGSTSLLAEINKVNTPKGWNRLYNRWEKSAHCVWDARNKILQEGLGSFLKGVGSAVKRFAKDPVGELALQLYALGQKAMQMGRKAIQGGMLKKLVGGIEKLLTMRRKFAKKYPKIDKVLVAVAGVTALIGASIVFSSDAQAADIVVNNWNPADAAQGVTDMIASDEMAQRIYELMTDPDKAEVLSRGIGQERYDAAVEALKKTIELKGELNLTEVANAISENPNAIEAKEFLTSEYSEALTIAAEDMLDLVKGGKKYIDNLDAKEAQEMMDKVSTSTAGSGQNINWDTMAMHIQQKLGNPGADIDTFLNSKGVLKTLEHFNIDSNQSKEAIFAALEAVN